MADWLAGAAEVVITPPVGTLLTGFGGRPSGAVGVHDDLYARALAVESEGTRAVLVTADLLGLDFDLVEGIRDQVRDACGIPAERLLLNCTHTHSGPAVITLRGMGRCDDAYREVLVRQIAGVVRMALDRLAPAQLRFGTAPVQVGINRREKRPDGKTVLGKNPDGVVDPTVYVLRADAESGAPVARFLSHAAHPVTLGAANLEITADYPGVAVSVVRQVEESDGAAPVALFAQGCCGNINCARAISSFVDARRLGRILGGAAIIASEEAEELGGSGIRSAVEMVTLPFLPPPPLEEASRIMESARARLAQVQSEGAHAGQVRLQQGIVAWAEDLARAAQAPERVGGQPFEVQALAVGEIAFVALPGEVFVELGLAIQERSPFKRTVVLAYSNGCVGYVPTAASYPDGGYEVENAIRYYGTLMIAPESEKLIVDAAVGLLQGL